VKNYQAELIFDDDDEMVEYSPERNQDTNDGLVEESGKGEKTS
jgi:hypothetical protein